MTDQAATLRVIHGGSKAAVPRRAVAVSGGKGGVGKSTVALNLAIAYSQLGARTLMVDTDLGMADLNLLLGVAPDKSLLDALSGTPIEDVLVSAHGIELLPALNGSYLLSTIGPAAQIDELAQRYSPLAPIRLLFTKLDECDRAPELALAPARIRLPITWVTTGQAVPEDIEQPTAARVLELASGGLGDLPAEPRRSRVA